MATARFDWEKIRAEYEVGATMGELAKKHGVSKAAISKHARAQGWTQDISDAVNRLTAAKVNGIVDTVNPEKRAEALSNAASAKAAVIARHKQEWENHQRLIDEALAREDFNAAKLAKITAETIRIRQDGERKAWGIVDTDVRPQTEKIKILPLYPEVMDIEAHDTAKDSL
jgi:hypothetical protein